jgi:ubiquinol-cytochrome c reductase iron-sulfur subunit
MTETVDLNRRRVLVTATSVVGGIGVVYTAVPFISFWQPSAAARAAGAPVEADISKLEPGQKMTVEWRGKPVWIVRRDPTMQQDLVTPNPQLRDPGSKVPQQPSNCQNDYRSIKPEILVMVGICTHLGCSPTYRPELAPEDLGDDWKGGFFCPCHGSRFDLAGRVYQGVPAPTNLEVPPHYYRTEREIVIGLEGAA